MVTKNMCHTYRLNRTMFALLTNGAPSCPSLVLVSAASSLLCYTFLSALLLHSVIGAHTDIHIIPHFFYNHNLYGIGLFILLPSESQSGYSAVIYRGSDRQRTMLSQICDVAAKFRMKLKIDLKRKYLEDNASIS